MAGSILACALILSLPLAVIYFLSRLLNRPSWLLPRRLLVGVLGLYVVLGVIFGALLWQASTNLCGVEDADTYFSPDRQHKVIVFRYDCGATTAYSLAASVMGAKQELPPHEAGNVITVYKPKTENYSVVWLDPRRVVIHMDSAPRAKQIVMDDVSVTLEHN